MFRAQRVSNDENDWSNDDLQRLQARRVRPSPLRAAVGTLRRNPCTGTIRASALLSPWSSPAASKPQVERTVQTGIGADHHQRKP